MGDPYLGSSGHSSIFRGIHSSLILYALNGISDALRAISGRHFQLRSESIRLTARGSLDC